jgi:carnitine 3-dehydrogenase
MKSIQTAGVIGAGVIGAGWIARLLLNGIDVNVFDPSSNAPENTDKVIDNAARSYANLHAAQLPKKGQLSFKDSVSGAAKDTEIVIEAVPERLDMKQAVYDEIELSASIDTIIASSTSGILPTDLQAKLSNPERLMVAHPFNPVYLLPLVEMVGGEKTSTIVIEKASDIFESIGMFPLHIKKEIPAFIADRLLESVWREALWLVNDGIATTQEIDDAIRYGFGLRWAQMGLFETYRLAGGEAGMRHFISQFGPCLKWPWTHLMDVPEFTEELVDKVSNQSDEQSGMHSIRVLEQKRDDNLVDILKVLKDNRWGAGNTLQAYDDQLAENSEEINFESLNLSQSLETYATTVPQKWADYNGHMNETHYLECFSKASDKIMAIVGVDRAYISNGNSFFTVETHIRHLDEVLVGKGVSVSTQVISGGGKKLHVFHFLYHQDGQLLATGEQMLIHVNLESRAACNPNELVSERITAISSAHQKLPSPDGVGRAVAQKL